MDQPPLADVTRLGRARKAADTRLKTITNELTTAVVASLRAGERPTRVAEEAGWTGAYVRKLARDNGIDPDPRYAERAERLRKPT